METKITKGEWTVITRSYEKKPKEIITGVGLVEQIKGGTYITTICDFPLPATDKEYIKQHEEIKANAKLIAAAPDLFEVVNILMNSTQKSGWVNENIELLEKANKAIKKATE